MFSSFFAHSNQEGNQESNQESNQAINQEHLGRIDGQQHTISVFFFQIDVLKTKVFFPFRFLIESLYLAGIKNVYEDIEKAVATPTSEFLKDPPWK